MQARISELEADHLREQQRRKQAEARVAELDRERATQELQLADQVSLIMMLIVFLL